VFHRTQRLLLRPIWPEDWRSIFDGIADEGIVRNLARAPWPYTQDDARQFANLPAGDPHFPRFLLTLASDASLVGCMGLDQKDGKTELGYWIARQQWGQGFATEAGHAVIKIAEMIGHESLAAGHFVDNPASGRVLMKLGFVPDGLTTARYSLGRGKTAPAAEYTLDLAAELVMQAA
jgi:RimJ/RimL family protein N-acetyltransferase